MKGRVNVWTNLKTIIFTREFRPLRTAVFMQFVFLCVLGHLGYIVFHNYALPTYAATYTWVQSSWSGGQSTSTPMHPGNQTGWNFFSSASSTVNAGNTVVLSPISASSTHTSQAEFAQGTFSQTTSTDSGSVTLSGETTAVDNWDTTILGAPTTTGAGSFMIRNGSDDTVYVLSGNGRNGFYSYSVSENSWTTLTAVPGAVSYGGFMIRNGSDDYIYVLAGNGTGFYRYSISGNSWTTLTSLPAASGLGAFMIRNGSDNDIYVIRGNSQTSFYRYSISGNSWTTLTAAPGAVSTGASLIRGGSSNDIYLVRGAGVTSFYRYSISGNSWTTLTSLPGAVSDGGGAIRNSTDDEIYVLAGGGTGFYRYSISGNSWTTLTTVPSTVGEGGRIIRNLSDNDIYVLPGNVSTNFYRYSISGNSWTTLTAVPGTVSLGGFMIRNSSDNEIYILRGNNTHSFFKYSIVGNSWDGSLESTLSATPGAIANLGSGSNMLRFGSRDTIYVLRGNDTASLYAYSISGNSWTTLTSAPGNIGNGGTMLGNESEDYLYVLAGGATTALYRYSISGNSWTTLTSAPASVSSGGTMIRNGSENYLYMVRGGSNTFYRYSISDNAWTTLTAPPSFISGGTLLRNGSEDYIYALKGGGQYTNFYRYSISGDSWTTLTSTPATVDGMMVRSDGEDYIYALRGDGTATFYRYSISGNSWTTLASAPSASMAQHMFRVGSDDYLYGTEGTQVYRYSISNNSWTPLTGMLSGLSGVMIQNTVDGDIYALSNNSTNFYRFVFDSVVYSSPGTYTSAVIDTGGNAGFTTLSLTTSTPNGTTLTLDVRAGDSPTPDETWTDWQTGISSGASISTLGTARYIQYRVNFSTSNSILTPSLSDIAFGYSRYTSGSLISSPYNAGDSSNVLGGISWTATTPAGTAVKFQVRTSANNSAYTDWIGPDGTNATYFTDSTGGQDMPSMFTNSENDQWIQYRVTLQSDGEETPTLTESVFTYVVNAPPDIVIVTSTPVVQSSTGVVALSYRVRDVDTTLGATPGFVSVELQYCTSNCASAGTEVWETAASSSLTGNYGSSIAVDSLNYTEYTLVWDPVVSYNNQYNNTDFKIRLRANDSEAANNYGITESDIFTIDTKDPVVSVVLDGRSDAPYNLTITATDDTVSGREMKISNNSDLSSDGLNGNSGTWIAYTATSTWDFPAGGTTVYYHVRDAYGNISNGGAIASIHTPAIPDQIVYRDVSNSDTSEWREFIAWGVIADPTPGFDHYTVWRSTDGTNYTALTTESDRLINYVIDDSLDTNTTYYYRVTAEDTDGNVSNYSQVASDKPDGQGGNDETPPTITAVSSTYIGTQGATIVWESDELSDSLVDYTTEEGGDFSNAETIGITAMADNASGLGQHSVVLSGLQPNTTYYFRVRSRDPDGNEGVGTSAPNGFSFTTLLGPSISDVAVSYVTNHEALITWITDEASDTYIYYSTNPDMTSSTLVGISENVNEHAYTIQNLILGTTYYFYVRSGVAEDAHVVDGEKRYYTFITTSDLDAPVLTFDEETDVAVSDSTISITWSTQETASSTVEYGTSNAYGTSVVNNNFNTDHSFILEDLLPGTLYYIRIKSADINHNISSAIEFSIATIDTADYTDPIISDVGVTVVTDDEALIEWTTDEGATGQVRYGTVSSTYIYASELVATYNVAHAITLSGLSTSTYYVYVVVSSDSSGNTVTSSQYSFTTREELTEESEVQLREEAARAEGVIAGQTSASRGGGGGSSSDRSAPILSNVVVSDITGSSARITWGSDEVGDSIVEFGVTSQYTRAAVDLEDSASHAVSLIDLSPDTTYSYRVSTADPSGNRSKFSSGTFTTLSTLEDINSIVPDTATVSGEETENLFVASIQKATDIIRTLSSQVSVGVLESTLLQQTQVIEELSALLPLPIIGGQPVVEEGSNYATISWTTDKLSNSLVEYAPADEYLLTNAYSQTVGNFDISANEHTVEVRGLIPNTVYHYRVISRTPTGAETKSRDFVFKTDTEFSEISNYKIEVLSPEEASFFWVTNLPSDTVITYTPYRLGVPDVEARKTERKSVYSTEHLIVLSDLEAGVAYDIELSGTDYGGSTVSKMIKGFSTNDTDLPPLIYQIQTESAIIPGGKDRIQVIISWVTNELSNSRVLYRRGFATEGTPFTDSTILDPGYVKKHIVVISNFESGQVYQFVVESTDSGGNTSISKTITILTPRKEESVFQVIMSNVEDIFSWTGKIKK